MVARSPDNPSSAGCRRERFATSTLVSAMQYDLMALVDQEPGRHEAEAIRGSCYEYASHFSTSSYRADLSLNVRFDRRQAAGIEWSQVNRMRRPVDNQFRYRLASSRRVENAQTLCPVAA